MSVYYLYGNDRSLIKADALTITQTHHIAPENVFLFDTEQSPAPDIVSRIKTRPLFASAWSYVIFTQNEGQTFIEPELLNEIDDEALVLIICSLGAKPKNVLSTVQVKEIKVTVVEQIKKHAQAHGVQLNYQSLQTMIAVCEKNLATGLSIITAASLSGKTMLSEEDIKTWVNKQNINQPQIWGLIDALFNHNLTLALSTAQTAEPLNVLAMITNRIGQIARIKETNLTEVEQVVSSLGLPNLRSGHSILTASKQLDAVKISKTWQLLAQADVELKRQKEPEVYFTYMLIELSELWNS